MDMLNLFTASSWVLPVIFAVTLHEAAHGWMAERFGDNTARYMGRITFNPFNHVDLIGTIVMPIMLFVVHSPVIFGYAKPVPVDFTRLQPPRLGMLMTAFAGPLSNIIQAVIAGIGLVIFAQFGAQAWVNLNFFHAILVNCALAAFNLLPFLPLDGGRVLRALLPGALGRAYARTEAFGMLLIVLLLFVPALHVVMEGVLVVASALITLVLLATGNGSYLG